MAGQFLHKMRLGAGVPGLVLLILSLPVHAAVVFTPLISFNNTNGANPNSLMLGKDGKLYGTTANGGSTGLGTVFQYTTNGTLTSVTSFSNLTNSSYSSLTPVGLVQKPDGSFFGTSFVGGGSNNVGSVFNLSTNFNPSFLVVFNYTNGSQPHAGAIYDTNDGNYYGTTVAGGTNGSDGSIYKLSSTGAFTSFYSFRGADGDAPYSCLTLAKDGYLYGTTAYGGSNNYGTIFRISTTNGVLTDLYSFTSGTDGAYPEAGLLQASDGLFYGTTSAGGAGSHGTIFRMDTKGNLSTLVAFDGTNGGTPSAALVENSGWLYGTCYFGGAYSEGTIFRINTNGTFTNLFSFNYTNGASPNCALLSTGNGVLYGTTTAGGTNGNGYGTIFQIRILPAPPMQIYYSPSGNELTLSWASVQGQNYQLQSATDLNSWNWVNIGPVITATGTNTSVTETVKAPIFYRLIIPQP